MCLTQQAGDLRRELAALKEKEPPRASPRALGKPRIEQAEDRAGALKRRIEQAHARARARVYTTRVYSAARVRTARQDAFVMSLFG